MYRPGRIGARRLDDRRVRVAARRVEGAGRERRAVQVVEPLARHHAEVDAHAVQARRQVARERDADVEGGATRAVRDGRLGQRHRDEDVDGGAVLVAVAVGDRALDAALDGQTGRRQQRRHRVLARQPHPAVLVERAFGGHQQAQLVSDDTRASEPGQHGLGKREVDVHARGTAGPPIGVGHRDVGVPTAVTRRAVGAEGQRARGGVGLTSCGSRRCRDEREQSDDQAADEDACCVVKPGHRPPRTGSQSWEADDERSRRAGSLRRRFAGRVEECRSRHAARQRSGGDASNNRSRSDG